MVVRLPISDGIKKGSLKPLVGIDFLGYIQLVI
jgi:hypothetical protein